MRFNINQGQKEFFSMSVIIESIGACVPSNRVTNDDLAKRVDTSDEWIRSHTGIGNRHLAGDDEATSDLGLEAAKIALKRANLTPDDIDFIIVATASPDFPGFPGVSNIIQEKIGAKTAGAMDLVAGCTGFIYALETGKAFIEAGMYKKILVLGAETLSKIVDWSDRSTCVLFGDGAGAVVLGKSDDESRGIGKGMLRSDGSGADCLMREAGGSRNPYVEGDTPYEKTCISMDGRRVYNFAVRVNTEMIDQVPALNGITHDEVKYIVPHQANERIISAAAKRLNIPLSKFYLNIEEYANTSAASIPIALNEMYEKNLLEKGDTLLLQGFGAGLTWGGTIIRW
jgi:3-oxoacyl-[acyl-carrier-protein] synthase-3